MIIRNQMKVYKVRDRETGLFSTGGTYPSWTKNGKAWPSRGALKSHLTMWADMGYKKTPKAIPESWEVVEFVFNLDESTVFSAREEAERAPKK